MDITSIKAAKLEITDDVRETKHWALLEKHGYWNSSLIKYLPSGCSLRMQSVRTRSGWDGPAEVSAPRCDRWRGSSCNSQKSQDFNRSQQYVHTYMHIICLPYTFKSNKSTFSMTFCVSFFNTRYNIFLC